MSINPASALTYSRKYSRTELKGGSIFHQFFGDVFSDSLFLGSWGFSAVLGQLGINVDDVVEMRNVNERVTESPRHLGIHLRCKHMCLIDWFD